MFSGAIIIIIHAFIKRQNPTCRSKALNNDVAKVTCKANSKTFKNTKNINKPSNLVCCSVLKLHEEGADGHAVKLQEDAVLNMKKAKQQYQTKVQEYQKAKEAAIRAEGEQQNQQFQQSQQHRYGAGMLYPSVGKMEKKKKLEEDTNLKVIKRWRL